MLKTVENLIEKNRILETEKSTITAEKQAIKIQYQNSEIRYQVLYQSFQEEIQKQLQEQNEKHQKEIQEIRNHFAEEYEILIQRFLQAQREKFGSKRERFIDSEPDEEGNVQQPLFEVPNTEEAAELKETLPGNIEPLIYVGKSEETASTKTKSQVQNKKRHKRLNAAGIPTREEIVPVSEEDRVCICGCRKELIRYELSHRLHYQPSVFEIVAEKREVVACSKSCGSEKSIQTAPKHLEILPKCRASESLLAYVAVSKVLDRQPLYHLEQKIKREHGWQIGRNTLARWMIQMSEKLQPLVNLMKDEILSYDVAAVDGTTLQVLNEPNRSPETKSQAYCVRGGPPGKEVTVFEYNAYLPKEYLVDFFTDYKGYIHADASSVYDKMAKSPDITLSYCHAHARRKFEPIEKAGKGKAVLATAAMRMFQALYKIEREAKEKNLSPEARYLLRKEKSVPILTGFKKWLDEYKDKVLPKSPIGQAIQYCLNHWEGFLTYLKDGRLEMDNNGTEREIRPFVIARKNFLFAATTAGADALGVHFTLILTAKNHGWDPMAYYTEILKKIPYCQTFSDFEKLLPWNLKSKEGLCSL